MTNHTFTLRSHEDLLATFRPRDQKQVTLPKHPFYPISVNHYYAWTDPSGTYAYLVFKRPDWEVPRGIVLQRNRSGAQHSPAGMCDWCHTPGKSDEIGLMVTSLSAHRTGGTWLCLDLDCQNKIEEKAGLAGKDMSIWIENLCKRISAFYECVHFDVN